MELENFPEAGKQVSRIILKTNYLYISNLMNKNHGINTNTKNLSR